VSAEVYKLIYCSQSLIQGTERERDAEIARILAASRECNRRYEITGALIFNSGRFAQALEGPQDAVKALFARIQRDPRHREVTVYRSGPGGSRDFPDWSMAYVPCESEDGFAAAAAALWRS
jgi:hypothetical protein